MDLDFANNAFEAAGMLVCLLLSGCGVTHPAEAGEMFGGPYAAGHPTKYANTAGQFKPLAGTCSSYD